jgi:hypothetical protein
MKADGTGCPVRFLLLVIEQSRRQPVIDLQESLDLLSLWIRGTVSHYHWAHPTHGQEGHTPSAGYTESRYVVT